MLRLVNLELTRDGTCGVRIDYQQWPSRGAVFLLGDRGSGRSTLLAALSGAPTIRFERGEVRLDGRQCPLPPDECVYVPRERSLDEACSLADAAQALAGCSWQVLEGTLQRLAFGNGQLPSADVGVSSLTPSWRRLVAIIGSLQPAARLYLVDRPTAGLSARHARWVRQRLSELAASALVLVVTDNPLDCIEVGGSAVLMAQGRIWESGPSPRFFSHPQSLAGRAFVKRGHCDLPQTGAPSSGAGIWWVIPGVLGGMGRPGVLTPLDEAWATIRDGRIRHMVCLEERRNYPLDPIRAEGIVSYHIPIPDRGIPDWVQALEICHALDSALLAREAVVFQGRHGLGRTGTLIALLLVWTGESAQQAVARVRAAEPRAIQSAAQEGFVHDFAQHVAGGKQFDVGPWVEVGAEACPYPSAARLAG